MFDTPTMNKIAYLGAMDPEMIRIKELLEAARVEVRQAMVAGQPVHAGNAYHADNLAEAHLVIECGPAPEGAMVIDHHRPGDPGYGRTPAEFLQASSLGQVISYLAEECLLPGEMFVEKEEDVGYTGTPGEWCGNWAIKSHPSMYEPIATIYQIPLDFLFAAAADHCLAAANQGRCPGVDPDALMRWRVEQRAAFQGRSVDEVLADIERARIALRNGMDMELSPHIEPPGCTCGGQYDCPACQMHPDFMGMPPEWATDMRGQHIPELPEAAVREGICFLADVKDRDGRTKIVCQSGSPEQIRAFMEQWAPGHGLVDIYGDPMRGIAGGYIS